MIPRAIEGQVRTLVAGLETILGANLVGIYLHGSAVLGCFGPWSDIDVIAVLRSSMSLDTKRRLAELILELSAGYEPPGPPRPIELDVVAEGALRPWRYPTWFDFHYGESFRAQFQAGELEPWPSRESRDLAAHVTVLRRAGVALAGPTVEEAFPDVPWSDYVDALTQDLEWCRKRFAEFPRYGVLSMARIWATLVTGEPQSKASGAEWALPRLPPALRPVLEHGRAHYVGVDTEERWDELPVADYLRVVSAEIDRV